jgi:molybdopterin molybdotransferase
MITPAAAAQLIREATPAWPQEDCPLLEAHGRILRVALRAERDLPPFDRATMDGYALRSAAVAAGVASFAVEGVQPAGCAPLTLGPTPEAAVEIMTGAVLPIGADAVVPYEDTARAGDRMTLAPGTVVAAGHAVHRRGSDHRAGGVIVAPGVRLTGREIAVAAACGYAQLAVSRLPRIAVVATGDELVELDEPVEPYQIRRSNDYALRAALAQAGYVQTDRFHLRDDRSAIATLLERLLADHDVVLLSGGVSKGKFDFLPEELARQGVRRVFQGVAQRPGKPLWFGTGSRNQLVFALPGNPVSAYTCLHRYVLPALAQAAGAVAAAAPLVPLAAAFAFRPPLACFLPVRLEATPEGGRRAVPAPGNTSGDFAGLVGTDGFVELPADGDVFPAGFLAAFWAWV